MHGYFPEDYSDNEFLSTRKALKDKKYIKTKSFNDMVGVFSRRMKGAAECKLRFPAFKKRLHSNFCSKHRLKSAHFNGVRYDFRHIDKAVLLLEIDNGDHKGNRLTNLVFSQKFSPATNFLYRDFPGV